MLQSRDLQGAGDAPAVDWEVERSSRGQQSGVSSTNLCSLWFVVCFTPVARNTPNF